MMMMMPLFPKCLTRRHGKTGPKLGPVKSKASINLNSYLLIRIAQKNI